MVAFGVPRRVASFVIPAGYSFNLDGSTLYLVLASLTIAQAAKLEMSLAQQIAMVFTFMLTSKGVAVFREPRWSSSPAPARASAYRERRGWRCCSRSTN